MSRVAAAAGVALIAALVSSCMQSTRAEDVALPGETPANPDDPYPDFSRPLTSAMPQMTDEEARKMDRQMAALASRRKSGAISEAEYRRRVEEMRRIRDSMPKAEAQ